MLGEGMTTETVDDQRQLQQEQCISTAPGTTNPTSTEAYFSEGHSPKLHRFPHGDTKCKYVRFLRKNTLHERLGSKPLSGQSPLLEHGLLVDPLRDAARKPNVSNLGLVRGIDQNVASCMVQEVGSGPAMNDWQVHSTFTC